MKSITKNPMSNEEIKELLYSNFGSDFKIGEIKELSEGYYSVAYDISILNEDFDLILKIEPPKDKNRLRYELDSLEIEVKSILHIKENYPELNIPVVEIISYKLHSKAEEGRDYFFCKKFKGNSFFSILKKLSKEEKKSIYTQLGELQSKLHKIKSDSFGLFVENKDYPTNAKSWFETFKILIDNLYRDCDIYNVKPPVKQEELDDILKLHKTSFDEVTVPHLIHWDLWEGNVFIDKDENGWFIEGIIDFERVLWGDPLMEVKFRKEFYNNDFVKAYGDEILLGSGAKVRDYFYSLYLFFIILVESKARQYPPIKRIGFQLFARYKMRSYYKKLKFLDSN